MLPALARHRNEEGRQVFIDGPDDEPFVGGAAVRTKLRRVDESITRFSHQNLTDLPVKVGLKAIYFFDEAI